MAEGRRERIRTKVREASLDILAPHEIMELVLYPFIPRKDTAPLARALLAEFGSIEQILKAKESDLLKISGLTRSAAFHIPLFLPLVSIAKGQQTLSDMPLNTIKNACDYFIDRIGYLAHEECHILCLNKKKQVITCKKLSSGDSVGSTICLRDIAEIILSTCATFVIVAHNHPSGDLTPSKDDLSITKNVKDLLYSLNVVLLDHIIVNKDTALSMRQHSYLDNLD